MWKIILAVIFLIDCAQQINGHITGKEGILIFGGINSNSSSSDESSCLLQVINPKFHENTNITTFWSRSPTYDMAAAAYFDGYRRFMFVTGGHTSKGSTFVTPTFMYDIMGNNVLRGPDLKQGRAHHSTVVDTGKVLYIFGGLTNPKDGETIPQHLDSCEKMTPVETYRTFLLTTFRWDPCARMPIPRWAFAAVLYKDKIYLIGGLSGVTNAVVQSSVDIYHTKTNTWSSGAPMPTKKSAFDAALLGEEIIICGGTTDGTTASKSCDSYSTKENKWTSNIATLNNGRVEPRLVVFDGTLYVVGGSENAGTALTTIEAYDPVNKKFTIIPEKMNNAKSFFAAVSVEMK